jgi:hypothetical protein
LQKVEINNYVLCFVQEEDGHPPEVTKPKNKPIPFQDNPSLDQRKPVEKYQHKPPDERKSTNLRKFSEPNQPAEIRQFFKELRPPDIGKPFTGSGPVETSMEADHSFVEATPTSVEADPHPHSRIRPAESGPGLVKAALYKLQPDPSDNSSAQSQNTEVQSSLPFPSSGIKAMLKGAYHRVLIPPSSKRCEGR